MSRWILLAGVFILSRTALAIVDGARVDTQDLVSRSIVSLEMHDPDPDGSIHIYHGSAVVTGRRTLLTASHNLIFLKDHLAGWVSLPEHRIKIRSVRFLPGFKMTKAGTSNDLAVIKIAEDLPGFYRPVRIAGEGDRLPAQLQIAGFGLSHDGPFNPSDLILRDGLSAVVGEDRGGDAAVIWTSGFPSTIAGGDSGGAAFSIVDRKIVLYGIAIHRRYDPGGVVLRDSAFTDTRPQQVWIRGSGAGANSPISEH